MKNIACSEKSSWRVMKKKLLLNMKSVSTQDPNYEKAYIFCKFSHPSSYCSELKENEYEHYQGDGDEHKNNPITGLGGK